MTPLETAFTFALTLVLCWLAFWLIVIWGATRA